MPKEVIKEWAGEHSARLEVRWGPDHFNTVQMLLNQSNHFKFVGDSQIYTGLAMTLHSAEDIDRLIKALKRAKRRTFDAS